MHGFSAKICCVASTRDCVCLRLDAVDSISTCTYDDIHANMDHVYNVQNTGASLSAGDDDGGDVRVRKCAQRGRQANMIQCY